MRFNLTLLERVNRSVDVLVVLKVGAVVIDQPRSQVLLCAKGGIALSGLMREQ
jgi:hypothetical protein